MDVRTMLLSGYYEAAVKEHGRVMVEEEILEMIYHDLADRALSAADSLGYRGLATTAAVVIVNSGSYSNEANHLAGKYCSRK